MFHNAGNAPPVMRVANRALSFTLGVSAAAIFLTASVATAQDTFQSAWFDDSTHETRVYPVEVEDGGGGGPPGADPFDASMTAVISNIALIAGGGTIGGDVLEFDVTITNTSGDPGSVLTAYAFQSKFSESPALASRIGDKLYSAVRIGGTAGPMVSVKKNGTSNGLFTGTWKGICINSSMDFLPEFNANLEDESLECAGTRTDTDADGEPELDMSLVGLEPGDSQTVRLRLDSGTTDGALHRVPAGTLTGIVGQRPDGFPTMETPGTVLEISDFTDNKVFFDADGSFNPSFAPAPDFSLAGQEFLTLPRVNFAFTDILGRNHTCGTYGLTTGACAGGPASSPLIDFLDTGDLEPGVQNFAAILQGFGEFVEVAPGEFEKPNVPYGPCESCGGIPYVPIAEFYVDNGDGETVTRQIVAGNYGALGGPDQYKATIDSLTAEDLKQEVLSGIDQEVDDGGSPPANNGFGATAVASFSELNVTPGGGANGGDVIDFKVSITNTSPTNSGIYLTSFNYQTKERGLADIGELDGTSQTRRDIRLDSTLPVCSDLSDRACWNPDLGIGQFPNVIGNGLLFGQMVWPRADSGRTGQVVDSDQVHVDTAKGIKPKNYWLESVKKNGPFTPILKGNRNFICIKSGLFNTDPDSDAACAGEPAILADEDGLPTPANVEKRLGLPPGKTQDVRMRMDFGDFRGVLLRIAPGTLTDQGSPSLGLRRFFDCSDQRELEYCHPDLVGTNIGYLPGTDAEWQTPVTLEEIEHVIVNQPGDSPTVMNFADNFGHILEMAGFRPSAEFYKKDNNPELPSELRGTLVREQVLGAYGGATSTDTLDDFNQSSQSLSSDWTGGTATTHYIVKDNSLRVKNGGLAFWDDPFGDSQEAAFRMTKPGKTKAGEVHALLMKAELEADGSGSAIRIDYVNKLKKISISRMDIAANGSVALQSIGLFSATLRKGEELRARILANGSIQVFIEGAPVGGAFNAGSDYAARGGMIGLFSNAKNGTLDDFSGGNH